MYRLSILPFLYLLLLSCNSNDVIKKNQEAAKLEIIKTEKAFEKLAAEEGLKIAFTHYGASDAIINRNDSLYNGLAAIASFYSKPTKGKIKFRDGVLQFLEVLKGNNVPIIIMSSSALGGDAIESCLKKEGHYFDNITIISNTFIWDEKGRAVGTHEPHLHAMSKEETIINNFPIYEEIKHRPNVILLGDTLGDVGMAVGFPYDNLIKIGFLNKDAQKRLDDFQKYYDITITNDGTFEYVNEVLQKILNN